MWHVPRFAEYHEYELIVVENVVEAAKWRLFPAWLAAMDALGYDGRPVFLNSMVAHPTPQSRDRMYYVFWRRGNRAPDLDFDVDAWCPSCERDVAARQVWKPRTKAWPLETWGRYRTQYLYRCPSCQGEAAPYAFPAGSAIDWSLRGERIGDRAEPLRPATMARIAKGLEKFGSDVVVPVGGNRFEREGYSRARPVGWPLGTVDTTLTQALVVPTDRGHDPGSKRARSAGEPGPTQTGRADLGVAMPPFMVTNRGTADNEHLNGAATSMGEPMRTLVAGGTHHAVIEPPAFVVKNYGGLDSSLGCMVKSPGDPLGTVTGQDHHAVVSMPRPFLTSYYGRGVGASAADEPASTVTTTSRHGLVEPGSSPAIEDCTFRMLEEWTTDLRASKQRARSTIRSYQLAVRAFLAYLCDPVYGWAGECERRFGTHPVLGGDDGTSSH
jgi:DNA (cytosine-5)-methyltransferase 1